MLRSWDHTKLRVDGWDGPQPETDDEIFTTTGRRYRILDPVYREGRLRSLLVIVLPADAPVLGNQFQWFWTPRTKSARAHARV
jgi:hypothetical protein